MDLQLANRVILVVGGSGLLGSAIVSRLEAEGATAIAASRRTGLDAGDDASIAATLHQVLADHGRLDGVVVTAAPAAQTLDPARNSDPAQIAEAVDAKALTFLRVANAALPILTAAGYGRVVGISGQNALITGNITGSVRNATLIVIAKNLADAAAGTGVTVNVVNPGPVSAQPEPDVAPGKPGQSSPEHTADLVAFLVSPLAGAISGESIAVGHRVRGAISL